MLITTGIGFDNYEIVDYLGIVCAQEVIGTGLFSDTGAAFADLFGTRASGYESKFKKAQNQALRELQSEAADLGANAIIAIDIDIDTLANNVIAVLTNGTAVRIRERIIEKNVESRIIPVVNYSNDSALRIGQAVVIHNMSSETYYIKLRGCATSRDNLPVGLQVKANFLSRFGTPILPVAIDFIQLDYNHLNFFETNVVEIKDDIDLSTIFSLKVIVEKYIDSNETIIEESCDYFDVSLNVKELNELKEKCGIDAVCQNSNKNDTILCNCGRIIPKEIKHCKVCGRRNIYWAADGRSIENLVDEMQKMNTAKEIVSFVAERHGTGSTQLSEYNKVMIQAIDLELSMGKSMKDYAIKKYKEIFMNVNPSEG